MVKTTVMLPEETIKWLREESYTTKKSIGSVIRNALNTVRGKPTVTKLKDIPESTDNVPMIDEKLYKKKASYFNPVPKPLKGKR